MNISYPVTCLKLLNACYHHGFGMDNATLVNGRRKIPRSCDDNMGLDLQFIHNNIARVLHDFLNDCYGLKMNQTNDFTLLIDVLRDPQAFFEHDYSYINFYLLF